MSLPSRERELKHFFLHVFCYRFLSLPSRERELKLIVSNYVYDVVEVAPLAGA